MYIAFKWLTGLALAMWLAMCVIDVCVKKTKKNHKNGSRMESYEWTYQNITLQMEQESKIHVEKELYGQKYQPDTAALHYAMFFAGAIAVSVFNKKSEIISYTKNTIAKLDFNAAVNIAVNNLKKTAILLYIAIEKIFATLWVITIKTISKLKLVKRGLKTSVVEKHKKLNFILLKKLKEIAEERRKLGQLLIAAIHENKNIRMQYQLESMAKNRLVRHIEDTQKKIKENRSRYVSFQHLYLVTHQENMFLKARIRKLLKEKDDAEKDLMSVINQVYQSKNNDLKVYCSRFIVRPKDNLLNNDVSAEVQKFLQKSCLSGATTSSWQVPSQADSAKDDEKIPSASSRITEILQEENSLAPLVSDAPKLKGLPGECIWTVKDKDGIIEKLYEYDYESDFDNGDTIRRIREYSVYYDKDCLLDFSSSRTIITEPSSITLRTLYPTSERFLTGSEAFQKFLQNNKNIVPSRSPAPPFLCG
ncbi:uncharacterized protein LOC114358383 [Ostrinia furnacalis]|uniref:uncharacterized protein LOC114358383 n=1 Tax=Ostrinia furnacalis TaxID=93504 RepID=UPI00103C9FA6|nr:uncharacterized protein LOC114358383 [Ostrinia furnacalis]